MSSVPDRPRVRLNNWREGKTVQIDEQSGREPGLAVPIEPAGGNEPRNRRSGINSWLRDLVVFVAVPPLIIIFLPQPVRVEGTSMLPMLEDQDRLFVNKMAYRVGEIHRGDVVVFLYPHDH